MNVGERGDPHVLAKQFVTQHGVTYPTLMDTENVTSEPYQVRALPTLAVIDRKGVLRYLSAGFDEAAVRKAVEAALAER